MARPALGGGLVRTLDNNANLTFNQLLGINDAGEAVGFYNDAAGLAHGYTLNISSGVFTPVTPSSAVTGDSVTAIGINDSDQVVGQYVDSAGNTHGFLYSYRDATFQTIDAPGGVGGTTVNGIDNSGSIVGFSTDVSGNTNGFLATSAAVTGYWEVASDGGIFSFGDAVFHGSTGAETLNKPVGGVAATP